MESRERRRAGGPLTNRSIKVVSRGPYLTENTERSETVYCLTSGSLLASGSLGVCVGRGGVGEGGGGEEVLDQPIHQSGQ